MTDGTCPPTVGISRMFTLIHIKILSYKRCQRFCTNPLSEMEQGKGGGGVSGILIYLKNYPIFPKLEPHREEHKIYIKDK